MFEGYRHLNELLQRHNMRAELGFCDEDFIIISVGELNNNKNHEIIIRALSEIEDKTVKYIICGQGELKEYLERLIAEKNLQERVKLLGYRSDIRELLHMADVFAFPSKREGLGLAALEAMASGLPLLTSDVHGINDYSMDGVTGYKVNLSNTNISLLIKQFQMHTQERCKMGINNVRSVEKYDIKNIHVEMQEIYILLNKKIRG